MRAMAYETYGGTEVLTETELPMPKLAPGELLVRVKCASVNPVDWKIMAGGLDPLMDVVYPVVPGWDVAGTVERVGIDTPEFAVGDEVMAYARKDYVHGGTFAEYVSVPVRAAAAKPASLSWQEAAGLPLAGLTAYQLLTRLATGKDDVVLIHGAAGGVGSFGVQIARALGARVIGTASPRNHDRLRELGCEPVEYGEGLVDRVRALAPDGVTVVADFVGGVLDVTQAVLAKGGRHASIADPTVLGAGGQWMWVRPDAEGLAELARLADAAAVPDLAALAEALRAELDEL
ncbi:alcohol dehydrogenase catalytic domain-containing protein, partial [Streptomyces sp. NPDC059389]|uniref:NADP-dependent oxidoreductase n=1 Tax=Streptomyces sp. NPDC059389 TaxID=3346818 RepID=UPI00368D3961